MAVDLDGAAALSAVSTGIATLDAMLKAIADEGGVQLKAGPGTAASPCHLNCQPLQLLCGSCASVPTLTPLESSPLEPRKCSK